MRRRLRPRSALSLACSSSCDEALARAVAGGEAVEAIQAAVDQAPRGGEVVLLERPADSRFFVGKEESQELGGDSGLAGELGPMHEIDASAVRVLRVVGAASDLNEAAAAEAGSVRRTLVAEVL